jgi:predicted site-specific integrase-resolvase
MLPIRTAAERLGVSTKTLRRWDLAGKLVPQRLPSGGRRYTEAQIDAFLGLTVSHPVLRCAAYARVSSSKQKVDGNLARQKDRLVSAAAEHGWDLVLVVEEVASGVNEHRRGLARLLKSAGKGEFEVLVVEYRDRLARFGYRYLEAAFQASGVRIEVVEAAEAVAKEPTQEMIDDLLAIVMVFAARLYGRRAAKVRSKVKAVLVEEQAEAVP